MHANGVKLVKIHALEVFISQLRAANSGDHTGYILTATPKIDKWKYWDVTSSGPVESDAWKEPKAIRNDKDHQLQ